MAWWRFGSKKNKNTKPQLVDDPAEAEKHSYPQSPASAGPERPHKDNEDFRILPSATDPVPDSQSRDHTIDEPELEEPYELQPSRPRESQDDDITALPGAPQHRVFDSGPHLRNIDQLRQSSSAPKRSLSSSISHTHRRTTKSRGRDTRPVDDEYEVEAEPTASPKQSSGGLFRRNSKRRISRTDLGDSTVSLPRAASLRSGMSNIQEHHRFDVGGLDIFSARPKIRYSFQQPISTPSRAVSRRTNRPDSQSGPFDPDGQAVDDLAEDYDAATIRELMERDKRRTEQRQKLHAEKAQKRLERHERRAREAAGLSNDPGESSSRAFEGLGLQNVDAGPVESVSLPQSSSKGKETRRADDTSDPFRDPPLIVDTTREPVDELQQPAVEAPPSTIPPPVSPTRTQVASVLATADPERSTTEVVDSSPVPFAGRRQGGLASLFRRSKRGSKDYATKAREPQEAFSNTSRESITRQQIPTYLREQPSLTATAMGIAVPKRTRSKFREDLPESPAAGPGYDASEALPADAAARAREAQAAASGGGLEGANQLLSSSLASLGSEGSWLSGPKSPRKRESRGLTSSSGLAEERPETSESDEVWTDAEAFTRPSPARPRAVHAQAIGTLREEVYQGRTDSSGQVTTTSAEDASPLPSPDEEAHTPPVEIVAHARHARQVSSGSAKLLDIPPRSELRKKASNDAASPSSPTGPRS